MAEDLLGLALRVSIMYAYALVLVRLMGKRSIGNLSAFDLVVTLIVGDLFDDVFWREVPLSQALVAFSVIGLLHLLIGYATYRSRAVERFFSGVPTPLVRNARFHREGMAKERLREEAVREQLRLQGEENLTEVRVATLEPSGETSVLKKEEYQPVQKGDLPRLKELFK
jgi:uncharacterized membrane protein YcaP (DUF421 family)